MIIFGLSSEKQAEQFHLQTSEYVIINNKPIEVFRKTIDGDDPLGKKIIITTAKLVQRKWKEEVEYLGL